MTVVAEKSGLVRAVGQVADDGDEVPSKFGFAVSQQIPFEEDYSNVHFYEAKGSRFVFEVVITDLEYEIPIISHHSPKMQGHNFWLH